MTGVGGERRESSSEQRRVVTLQSEERFVPGSQRLATLRERGRAFALLVLLEYQMAAAAVDA